MGVYNDLVINPICIFDKYNSENSQSIYILSDDKFKSRSVVMVMLYTTDLAIYIGILKDYSSSNHNRIWLGSSCVVNSANNVTVNFTVDGSSYPKIVMSSDYWHGYYGFICLL